MPDSSFRLFCTFVVRVDFSIYECRTLSFLTQLFFSSVFFFALENQPENISIVCVYPFKFCCFHVFRFFFSLVHCHFRLLFSSVLSNKHIHFKLTLAVCVFFVHTFFIALSRFVHFKRTIAAFFSFFSLSQMQTYKVVNTLLLLFSCVHFLYQFCWRSFFLLRLRII